MKVREAKEPSEIATMKPRCGYPLSSNYFNVVCTARSVIHKTILTYIHIRCTESRATCFGTTWVPSSGNQVKLPINWRTDRLYWDGLFLWILIIRSGKWATNDFAHVICKSALAIWPGHNREFSPGGRGTAGKYLTNLNLDYLGIILLILIFGW